MTSPQIIEASIVHCNYLARGLAHPNVQNPAINVHGIFSNSKSCWTINVQQLQSIFNSKNCWTPPFQIQNEGKVARNAKKVIREVIDWKISLLEFNPPLELCCKDGGPYKLIVTWWEMATRLATQPPSSSCICPRFLIVDKFSNFFRTMTVWLKFLSSSPSHVLTKTSKNVVSKVVLKFGYFDRYLRSFSSYATWAKKEVRELW